MEARLVIFLAFTSVTLTANTLVVWFAYKAFANITGKITEGMREISTSGTTQSWIRSLDVASAQAAVVTQTAKTQIESFEPVLARAQDVYGYSLAKVDAKFETICSTVTEQVEKAQNAILAPAEKIGLVASGIQAVLGFTFRRD